MTGIGSRLARLERQRATGPHWTPEQVQADVDRLTLLMPHHPTPTGLTDPEGVRWLMRLLTDHTTGCPTGACP